MLSSLRSELRELRKGSVKPVSKMLKHEVIMELEKLRGHQEKELKHEEKELVKAKVPRQVAEKVEEVQKAEHKKQVRKMKEEVEKKKSPKKN